MCVQALAQDQLRSVRELTGDGLIIPATARICDGDTNYAERISIQQGEGNIILTNPDMLHVNLLPEV
jgi:DEAD/DEAH box helicase domain-containing protein